MSAGCRTGVDRKPLDHTEAEYLGFTPVVHVTDEFRPRPEGRLRPAGATDLGDRRRVAAARPVPYYLRMYGLPPDPVFVDHIRQSRYQAPTVDPARKQAEQAVSGGIDRLAAG